MPPNLQNKTRDLPFCFASRTWFAFAFAPTLAMFDTGASSSLGAYLIVLPVAFALAYVLFGLMNQVDSTGSRRWKLGAAAILVVGFLFGGWMFRDLIAGWTVQERYLPDRSWLGGLLEYCGYNAVDWPNRYISYLGGLLGATSGILGAGAIRKVAEKFRTKKRDT